MITITTGNLAEFAWIVMGIWAAVTIFQEILEDVIEWFDNNRYWRERYNNLSKEFNDLHTKHRELMEKNDDQ
jgi:hypothetical protein